MNAELHPFPQKPRLAQAITLPSDLSCEPPIRPHDPTKRPWSEVAAAYKILASLTGISNGERQVGPSLREWASTFDWGSNGHKLLANLVDRLGLQCEWNAATQKSVWSQKSTQPNTQVNTQQNRVMAVVGDEAKTQPKTQGFSQPSRDKPNQKPKENQQRRGFQPGQIPNEKPNLACVREESLGSGLGEIKNLNSPKPKHEVLEIEFNESEQWVRDHVLEDFRKIQMRLRPEFIRDWFDRIGVEAFIGLWDRLRVCSFKDPIQTYPGFIFGAVKAVQAGHAGWVKNANELWRVNPQLEWMKPIETDWFEVGNSREKILLGLHDRESTYEKRERVITAFCKKENIPESITNDFSFLDLNAIRSSIAVHLIGQDRWTAEELDQIKEDALEEFSIALKGLPDDDPLAETVFYEVLLANLGLPWLE